MLKLPSKQHQHNALRAFAEEYEPVAQAGYLQAELRKELGAESVWARWVQRYEATLWGFDTLAYDALGRQTARPAADEAAWKQYIWPSFRLRRGLLANRELDQYSDELLMQVVAGLVAHRIPEIRMQLAALSLDWSPTDVGLPWPELLERELHRCFLLLARKGNGHSDVDEVVAAISRLHSLQLQKERELAATEPDDFVAARVLALYNAIRSVEIAVKFVQDGVSVGGEPIKVVAAKDDVDAFVSDARDLLSGLDSDLRIKVWQLRHGLHALIDSSVYALRLPASVESMVQRLASRDVNPILDTWHPQREALYAGSLLDPTRDAVVISLPTSSGKTFLAEMAIVQALDEGRGRVVYTAPTRALVNQVARNLRRDLGESFQIRIASPAYELDVVEDELLKDDFDVLVTTPEKFELLFRIKHESVREVALVVVDEAHNIACEDRGARLELLLASLRRERRCRFVLLTPFAKNAADLASWLGGESGASVHIDWRPNDRMVGCSSIARRRGTSYLKLASLPTVHSDFPEGIVASLGAVDDDTSLSRQELSVLTAVRLAEKKRGGVLLLASSTAKAEEMARKTAELRPRRDLRADARLVAAYLDTEAGTSHQMRALLEHGVVYHHAGLSPEGRYLIERLVEEGAADVVCATTTLAQGVHFPLSAAVIEGTHRTKAWTGRDGVTRFAKVPIPPEEFWNIAGRVGRAMEDPLGAIVFSTTSSSTRTTVKEYLKKDAEKVVSSLMNMLLSVQSFDMDLTKTAPLWRYKELSAFVQYIMHAISVSGVSATRRDIDALVRGSFVYQELRRDNPTAAEQLTRLAKGYLEAVTAAKGDSIGWYSKMADGTGFSSGSVDLVYGTLNGTVSPDQWSPEDVFTRAGTPSDVLVEVVNVLSRVPEVRLGERENWETQFDPVRVASITTEWVNGAPLGELAARYYSDDLSRATKHIHGTITSLMPWGLRAVHRVLSSSSAPVSEADIVPAMAMYGVRTAEAVSLRMLGVPRIVAEGLARQARRDEVGPKDMRNWLEGVPASSWQGSLPSGSKVSGQECALLWRVMEGNEPWKRLRS